MVMDPRRASELYQQIEDRTLADYYELRLDVIETYRAEEPDRFKELRDDWRKAVALRHAVAVAKVITAQERDAKIVTRIKLRNIVHYVCGAFAVGLGANFAYWVINTPAEQGMSFRVLAVGIGTYVSVLMYRATGGKVVIPPVSRI